MQKHHRPSDLDCVLPANPEIVPTNVAFTAHQYTFDLRAVGLVDQHHVRACLEAIDIRIDRLFDLQRGRLLRVVVEPSEIHRTPPTSSHAMCRSANPEREYDNCPARRSPQSSVAMAASRRAAAPTLARSTAHARDRHASESCAAES